MGVLQDKILDKKYIYGPFGKIESYGRRLMLFYLASVWLHVSHATGNRSTTFCFVCSNAVSIRTQVLLARVPSKSRSSHLTLPTQRMVREGRQTLDQIIVC